MKRNNLLDEHTLNILKAAMPHVHPRAQSGVNVILKASDLMDTIEGNGPDGELSTMDLAEWKPEPEEMLLSVREVLYPRETEVVDMILNFIKARKIYSAYQSYSQDILEAQGINNRNNGLNSKSPFGFNPFSMFGMNPFGMNNNQRNRMNNRRDMNQTAQANNNMQASQADSTANANANQQQQQQVPNFLNFLMSQMTPEQRQTFDMLSMVMNNMPNGDMSTQNVKAQENDPNKVSSQGVNNENSNK